MGNTNNTLIYYNSLAGIALLLHIPEDLKENLYIYRFLQTVFLVIMGPSLN